MKTLSKLEQEIERKENELKQLRIDKTEAIRRAPSQPIQKFAEFLHDSYCRMNHTDGCGWSYEYWSNPSWSKNDWLQKARAVLTFIKDNEVV